MYGFFKRCELVRPDGRGGIERWVTPLPAHVAVEGSRVRIWLDDAHEWTDGWTVISAEEAPLKSAPQPCVVVPPVRQSSLN